MEQRMVKFYSKESNLLALHAIPGHFATSNSHINFYIDVTGIRARITEAEEAAVRTSGLCGYGRMYGRYGGDRCVSGERI